MKLAYRIAVRFLKASKGQTLLIMAGIAIGVSVQIFIGSLIQGLQTGLIQKTIGNSPHITIQAKDDKTISDYQSIITTISEEFTIISAIAPVMDVPALLNYEDDTYSVLLRGISFAEADRIYKTEERIYEGKVPASINEIAVGRELQEELGLLVGDTLNILANSNDTQQFVISGFFDFKVASLNRSWLLTTLSSTQDLYRSAGASSIEIQVNDVFAADSIAEEIANGLGVNFALTDWKGQNAELLSGLQGQSISSIMIQVFVLLAVVLGITSVLAITVLQKSRQIGILKAMGIKDKHASLVFLFQGFLLGVGGTIMGILLGILLGWSFTKFALNPDGSPVVALTLSSSFILFSASVAIVSSIFASLVPAYRSSKLNPIEVIKNG